MYVLLMDLLEIFIEKKGGKINDSLVCSENHAYVISKIMIMISPASLSSTKLIQAAQKLIIVKWTKKWSSD